MQIPGGGGGGGGIPAIPGGGGGGGILPVMPIHDMFTTILRIKNSA
jgi:hypothetical protein